MWAKKKVSFMNIKKGIIKIDPMFATLWDITWMATCYHSSRMEWWHHSRWATDVIKVHTAYILLQYCYMFCFVFNGFSCYHTLFHSIWWGKWGVTCSDVTSLYLMFGHCNIVNPFNRISGFIWKKITNEMKYQLGLLHIIEK